MWTTVDGFLTCWATWELQWLDFYYVSFHSSGSSLRSGTYGLKRSYNPKQASINIGQLSSTRNKRFFFSTYQTLASCRMSTPVRVTTRVCLSTERRRAITHQGCVEDFKVLKSDIWLLIQWEWKMIGKKYICWGQSCVSCATEVNLPHPRNIRKYYFLYKPINWWQVIVFQGIQHAFKNILWLLEFLSWLSGNKSN